VLVCGRFPVSDQLHAFSLFSLCGSFVVCAISSVTNYHICISLPIYVPFNASFLQSYVVTGHWYYYVLPPGDSFYVLVVWTLYSLI